MYSELECGICYQTYNAGRRCPRELRCQHSFCESCLLALCRPRGSEGARPQPDRTIACPLCRQTTSVSCEGKIRAELRVDETVLHLLLDAGLLDEEEEEEEEEEEGGHVHDEDDEEEEGGEGEEGASLVELSAEESDSSARARSGKLRRFWRKAWWAISGRSSQQSGAQSDCMTNEDLRNFAMMSCYMF